MNTRTRPGIDLNLNLFGKRYFGHHGSLKLDQIHTFDRLGRIPVFQCLPTSSSTRFAALAWTAIYPAA